MSSQLSLPNLFIEKNGTASECSCVTKTHELSCFCNTKTGEFMVRPKVAVARSRTVNVRLTEDEHAEMMAAATALGLTTLSEYIRRLHQEADDIHPMLEGSVLKADTSVSYPPPKLFSSTRNGELYVGDSLGLLNKKLSPKSVDLIMTSPPFGLVRKKSYGNKDADEYLDWFRPFAEGFRRVLKDSGSLVIDIGGSWNQGAPTRSLYHFELLLMLCHEYGFHLCEEHFWWNPAKLPTPAEWVNVRRVRVKDAVNCIWWLSTTPWPKSNNRRVLAPYSDSMQHLLVNGYKAKLRPSGHDISTKFQKNNGGSVPPNLIALANTESNSHYQEYCHKNGLPVHPARYPVGIPAYFTKFLTDPGDLVVDPFAGSCVTGEACEALRRRWICCELDEQFLKGALARFEREKVESMPKGKAKQISPRTKPYEIFPPCAVAVSDEDAPLFADGGRDRPKVMSSAKKIKAS
jgi:DNA modification methylase